MRSYVRSTKLWASAADTVTVTGVEVQALSATAELTGATVSADSAPTTSSASTPMPVPVEAGFLLPVHSILIVWAVLASPVAVKSLAWWAVEGA